MRCTDSATACLVALLFSSGMGSAATQRSQAAKHPLPELLQKVEKKYVRAKTLLADFTQLNEVAAMKSKKKSSGRIAVKRPNKVRWETLQPDANLLVSDGRKFWFYTPPFDEGEHGQLIERKSSQAQSKLAQALLSGSFSILEEMKIKRKDANHFSLFPKAGTAGTVRQADIEVDPKALVIRKVTLAHVGGNRTEIALSAIELGKPLKDDLFVFTAPPNTDRVEP